MDFYFNDIYPNQGFHNTRTNTIPEPEDKQALAENEVASIKAKVNPKQKKGVLLALGLFLIIVMVLGVSK